MDEQLPQNTFSDALISWEFSEFEEYARSNGWFVWFGILAALLIGIALFTDNYLFAVIIVLSSLILFLQNWSRPNRLRFSVSPSGIKIGAKNVPMKAVKEFWIAYDPPKVKRIYFEFHSALQPTLGIPLEDTNPLEVRSILLNYLPENLEREDELTSDTLARLLKL